MSVIEIAEVVGSPVGTVKTRLRRGRLLLEAQMKVLAETPRVVASTLAGFERWAGAVRDGIGEKDR
jgi:RNA polymerase sigma-70 factor (ECF subfamily)